MKRTRPTSLRHAYKAQQGELRCCATETEEQVGQVAIAAARLTPACYVKNCPVALPPIGVRAALARGGQSARMAAGPTTRERRRVAELAGRNGVVEVGRKPTQRVRTEQRVRYPAAALMGRRVSNLPAQRRDPGVAA